MCTSYNQSNENYTARYRELNVSAPLIIPSWVKPENRALALIYAFICLVVVPNASWADQSDTYNQSLKKIAQEITAISRNLNANKALLKTEQDKLFESEKALARADKKLQATVTKIQEVMSQKVQLDEQLQSAQVLQVANRSALLELIRSRYRDGQDNYLKKLLNQENPYAVGRLNNYRQIMTAAFQSKAEEVQRAIAEVTQLKLRQTGLLQQLEYEQQQQQQQEAKFKKAQQKRATSVAKLNDKVVQSTDKLKRLQQDRARLNSLLSKIKAKAAELARLEKKRLQEKQAQERSSSSKSDKTSNKPKKTKVSRPLVSGGFVKQKGRLSYPVDAKRSVKYGARVAASGMLSEGILFNTRGSVSVKSIFRGRVLFADYLKGYGLLIIIDHGDDHISLYGHNASLLKNVGDLVETNDVISMSGVTGGLQAPGVYFEIRDNTTPVDPAKWCR